MCLLLLLRDRSVRHRCIVLRIHLATSALMTLLVATLENNPCDAFELLADAKHALNTALFFSNSKERKEVDDLVHELYV